MQHTVIWSRLGLLLRLAAAWYVIQILATILLGTLAAAATAGFMGPRISPEELLVAVAMGGIGSAFMGAILFFPYTSGAVAIYAAVAQVRAVGAAPLGAFHSLRIQVPWLPEEALAELENSLGTLGATAVETRGGHVQARFAPPSWSGAWRRWTQTDEVTVEVLPDALVVRAHPLSRLLFRWLWVDRGRNFHRLERLQTLMADRMARTRQAMQAELLEEAQAARLAQAELLLLRAQMEPHFLFNTLAHLRELVRTGDTAAALAMVDALVAHTRTASEQIRRTSHSLGDEVASTENYITLVRLRFGERIAVRAEVPPELRAMEVPVGVLLIPVENAVKHGLEPARKGGTVLVRASREENRLCLEVLDDGVGLPAESPQGTGLANLRQRLRLAHGEGATLTIEERETGGVRVHICLPLHT